MNRFIRKHPFSIFAVFYFLLLVFWWLKIFISGSSEGSENYLFNLSYIVFNCLGGFAGLIIAHEKWGGLSSHIGKGLSFLSLGLLGQGFGLIIWTYYNLVLKVEVPYPSIADIGYFSLIPFYSFAMINFAQATGAKSAIKTLTGQLLSIGVIIFVLSICFILFISNVGFDLSQPIKTLLDFAYPTGEAIAISLGIITYSLSRKYLGGSMKSKIEYIIIALIFQFLTEFAFLYSSGQGTYYNASFIDLMYAGSYFLMTIAILSFRHTD